MKKNGQTKATKKTAFCEEGRFRFWLFLVVFGFLFW
jgi:hypothetical protein